MEARVKTLVRRFRELPLVRELKSLLRAGGRWRADLRESYVLKHPPPHELAIAAIFKNEAANLDEWLRFHRGIGATQFYLYNNASTDDYLAALRPWIDKRLVTLTQWPAALAQRSAYMHCLRAHWRDARWIAFIDLDEFLFSPQAVDIRPILRSYADLPALYIYWTKFGSSGHMRRPAMPVVEAYLRREPLGLSDSGKSIVNPRYVRNVPNAHHFALWRGHTVDTLRRPTMSPRGPALPNCPPVYDVLRINHYFFKSQEDLAAKVARGDAFYDASRDFERHLSGDRLANAEEDLTILAVWRDILRAEGVPLQE
ncbi:MAG TPA: glycosyltransferase family 92 protein [Xanthobacteraceae bacterium]|nr:glycosyltransferase family 92 protein [Xanthobacteraceae bacterium]